MLARATAVFFDREARVDRSPGEVFECSDARFAEINAAGHGVLVEAVDEQPKPKRAPRKPKE